MTMINFLKKDKKYTHSLLCISCLSKSICFSEEIEQNKKKESNFVNKFNDENESYLFGNIIVDSSIKSKDIIEDFKSSIPFIKPKIELKGGFFFNLNSNDDNYLYKEIGASGKLVIFDCYPIGVFFKKQVNAFSDLFYFDGIKVQYWINNCFFNKTVSLKSGVTLEYGSSEYYINEDVKTLEIKYKGILNKNILNQDFAFYLDGGLSFGGNNSLQINKIYEQFNILNIEKPFFKTNSSNFVHIFIPNILLKCDVNHKLFSGGLKLLIGLNPFLYEKKYFKFGLIADFNWKEISIVKDIKAKVSLGINDQNMTYFYENDPIKEIKDDYFLLHYPSAITFNGSCNLDWISFINKVEKLSFVSECSSSFEFKVDFVFNVNIDYYTLYIKKVKNSLCGNFRIDIESLKIKLNGNNITNNKLKFILDNSSVDILKLSLKGKNKIKTDFNSVENSEIKFDGMLLGVTLTKGEFNWDKYGLNFNVTVLGDDFGPCFGGSDGFKFQWKDILSLGCKWNFAEYWENRKN